MGKRKKVCVSIPLLLSYECDTSRLLHDYRDLTVVYILIITCWFKFVIRSGSCMNHSFCDMCLEVSLFWFFFTYCSCIFHFRFKNVKMATMVKTVLISVDSAWVVHLAIKLMGYVQVVVRFHGPALGVTKKKVTTATI